MITLTDGERALLRALRAAHPLRPVELTTMLTLARLLDLPLAAVSEVWLAAREVAALPVESSDRPF